MLFGAISVYEECGEDEEDEEDEESVLRGFGAISLFRDHSYESARQCAVVSEGQAQEIVSVVADAEAEAERPVEEERRPVEEESAEAAPVCSVCWMASEQSVSTGCCQTVLCAECVTGMMQATIDYGRNGYVMNCQCGELMEDSVMRLAKHEVFSRHQALMGVVANNDKGLVWCYCPRKGCAKRVHLPEKSRRGFCSDCDKSFCADCMEPHSRYSPCTAYEVGKCISSPSYALNQLWKVVWTKPCPDCGERIEKNGGCSHMSCRCGAYFCWRCGHDLNKGGVHCKRWIAAAVVGIGAAAVITAPITIPLAVVAAPPAAVGTCAYVIHKRRRRQRRQQRWSQRRSKY